MSEPRYISTAYSPHAFLDYNPTLSTLSVGFRLDQPMGGASRRSDAGKRKRSRYFLHQLFLFSFLSLLAQFSSGYVPPPKITALARQSFFYSFSPCQIPAAAPFPCSFRPRGGDSFLLFPAPVCFTTFL